MRRHPVSAALCLVSVLWIGCAKPDAVLDVGSDPKPAVYTVNYPLQYFAERIAGDLADVSFPAPSGVDPVFWEPDPDVVQAYQQADLILLNGAGYAGWVEKVSLPLSKTVDTSASFHDRYIQVEDLITHTHGPEGEHAHGGTAFTTWLDPSLAREHARATAAALLRLLPDSAAVVEGNLAALEQDLDGLDQLFREVNAGYHGQPLLASHPVYQYLARAGGWNLKSMHWEPNEMPPAGEWTKLDGLLRTHRARWMIWEAEPIGEIAAELQLRGVQRAVFHPCGQTPVSGDYLTVMRANLERLRPVLRPR